MSSSSEIKCRRAFTAPRSEPLRQYWLKRDEGDDAADWRRVPVRPFKFWAASSAGCIQEPCSRSDPPESVFHHSVWYILFRAVKPNIFIGSSSEGLPVARAIQTELVTDAYVPVWNQGVFGLGQESVSTEVWAGMTSAGSLFWSGGPFLHDLPSLPVSAAPKAELDH